MQAYHNDESVKAKYLSRVRAHRAADELIQGATQGHTSEGFRGCAVVCTLERYDHGGYETELGIPRALARIEDGIFEGLSPKDAMAWPEQFLEAIPVGADLSGIKEQFLFWLLVDPVDGVIKYAKTQRSKEAIEKVGELYRRKIAGETIELSEWKSAYAYAHASAADYAAYAAASAASAADYAASAASAAYAAYATYAAAQASAAAYAASAAAYAAYAAAYSADAYAAADAAAAASAAAYSADAYADRKKVRKKQASKLLELLHNAPILETA
jgi:hypothetical protein